MSNIPISKHKIRTLLIQRKSLVNVLLKIPLGVKVCRYIFIIFFTCISCFCIWVLFSICKCQILKLLSTGREMSYTINVAYEYPPISFSSYFSKGTATVGSQWAHTRYTTARDLKSSLEGALCPFPDLYAVLLSLINLDHLTTRSEQSISPFTPWINLSWRVHHFTVNALLLEGVILIK